MFSVLAGRKYFKIESSRYQRDELLQVFFTLSFIYPTYETNGRKWDHNFTYRNHSEGELAKDRLTAAKP